MEYTKLKDIATFPTGKLNSNAAVEDGMYPFFTCSHEALRIDSYSYDGEYVLLGGNNANGDFPIFYYKGKFDAYQRTYLIQSIIPEKYSTKYLYYAISLKLSQMKRHAAGTATKFLTQPILKNIYIENHSRNVQDQIISIISTYDNLIEVNNKRIKVLEQMAENLYKEWFVRFRFPGHEYIHFENGVPTDWKIKMFSSVANIMSGGTPKTHNEDYYGGDIPFYTPKDSVEHYYALDTITTITEDGLRHCNSKLYPKDTIMITARGTVGNINLLAVPMAMNQSCYALSSDIVHSQYFLFFMIKREIHKLQKMASGGVFDTIIVKTFDHIKVVLPPEELIKRFHTIISPVIDSIHSLLKQNRVLIKQRDFLLPRLMSGKLEV